MSASISSTGSLHSQPDKAYSLDHSEGIQSVHKVQTCGQNSEFIVIGGHKYMRHELMNAMAGTLNPGLAPYPKHQFANAAPLGLCGFAMSVLVLSILNCRLKAVGTSFGLCIFYGGGIQFLAGVWEMVLGNTFAATAFVSFGCFWISFGTMSVEAFGITAAYADTDQYGNAVGFFLIGWGIFCFGIILASLKSTVTFLGMFVFTDATFVILAGANMSANYAEALTRAGGVTGVIAGLLAFYNAFEGVANRSNSYMVPPPLPLTQKWR